MEETQKDVCHNHRILLRRQVRASRRCTVITPLLRPAVTGETGTGSANTSGFVDVVIGLF